MTARLVAALCISSGTLKAQTHVISRVSDLQALLLEESDIQSIIVVSSSLSLISKVNGGET
jgi:hypothetical protein